MSWLWFSTGALGLAAIILLFLTLRARRVQAAQKKLIADALHELSSNLTIIQTNSELFLSEKPPAAAAAVVADNLKEVEKISRIMKMLWQKLDSEQ